MMLFRVLAASAVVAAVQSHAARAELTTPDCAAMAAFAAAIDLSERETLNPLTTVGFATALQGEEMVALYGKRASDFTIEEADAAREAAKACRKQVGKAESKALAGLEKEFGRGVGGALEAIAKGEAELEPALAALASAPDGLDKLRALAAFRALSTGDRDGFRAATRHMGRDTDKLVDGVARALKSLPQAVIAERVLPALEPGAAASLDAALAETRAQLDALEVSERTLQRYDSLSAKIADPVAASLPADAAPELKKAVADRRAAIEQELIAAETAKFEAAPSDAHRIGAIETAAGGSLMRQLSPATAEAYRDDLRARRQELALSLISGLPADAQTLAELPALGQALLSSPAGLVGPTEQAALEQALEERRQAAGAVVAEEALAQIAATPVETGAFATLERTAGDALLRALPPADAETVRQAAEAKRAEIGEALFKLISDELAGMAEEEQSLKVIDTALLPGVRGWPASAGAHKPRIVDLVVARRNAILAAITASQRGPLEGRVYASRDGAMKLEFRGGEDAYLTDPSGQTVLAPYKEDGEERVQVTLPQATVVLTREGRWLVGGPIQLERQDDR